ncbi:LysR family transcriptional regulator [Aminipila luticellarii]|uniref:LysR family transcriptional regulator n=1 Tax=Aminipila luticellarii TaxID=2507160 RepID=A0A410PTH1_9FIRM|nr:LysR family transcriptional regulator [Aminipila luticellarii]QAT42190.1 LysR family transcriptional regulator [Aminipila luticellarii]
MSTQKYEAFIKTAELGSFKKAAESLGYTQAGISYMLNTLEDELGVILFIRDYGGVRLTSEGEQILPWIRDVCNSERRLNARLNELKSVESGIIRVAAFTSISIHWLPGMIHAFLQEHPKVEFDLRWSDDSNELEQLIYRGDVDCGFLILPAPKDLITIPLKKEHLMAVLPENHPLADAPYFPIAALAEYPYIGLKEEELYSETEQVFTSHDIKPNVFITAENDYTVMALVSKGFGFSIFPELSLLSPCFPMVRKELESPVYRELAIAIRSYETASTATLSFLECAEQWVNDFYKEE